VDSREGTGIICVCGADVHLLFFAERLADQRPAEGRSAVSACSAASSRFGGGRNLSANLR